MPETSYEYILEFLKNGGEPLGEFRPSVDWDPAREWTRFLAVRRGLTTDGAALRDTIQPIWEQKAGPYVSGFRVDVSGGETAKVSCDFPLTYWYELAQDAASYLVSQGRLQAGELFLYRVSAHACDDPSGTPAARFAVEAAAPRPELGEDSLEDIRRECELIAPLQEEDTPVFIPEQVLLETEALKEEAGATEVGGILVGRLCRDASVPEVFAEVTAQIPALHTSASRTRLSFTAETWTAVRSALALRRRGEVMLGWYHTHPSRHWREPECERNDRASSRLTTGAFFSADGRVQHRSGAERRTSRP